MEAQYRYRPILFFVLTYVLSWAPLILAARYSYEPGMGLYRQLWSLVGLLGPTVAALVMVWTSGNSTLKSDFINRLWNPRRFSLPYLFVTILIMPIASYIAIWISVTQFGKPTSQLNLIPNLVSWLPIILLAPTLEEIGWRGYAMDSIRDKLGMLSASVLFSVLWAIWHIPLVFVNHTYQHDLAMGDPVYLANFFISIIPAGVIGAWLYYKHNRSILAGILYHFMLNTVAIAFTVDQFTKCIITAVFGIVAVLIIVVDRKAFFEGPRNFVTEAAPKA